MNIVNVININYERFVVELSGDACVVGLRSVLDSSSLKF